MDLDGDSNFTRNGHTRVNLRPSEEVRSLGVASLGRLIVFPAGRRRDRSGARRMDHPPLAPSLIGATPLPTINRKRSRAAQLAECFARRKWAKEAKKTNTNKWNLNERKKERATKLETFSLLVFICLIYLISRALSFESKLKHSHSSHADVKSMRAPSSLSRGNYKLRLLFISHSIPLISIASR